MLGNLKTQTNGKNSGDFLGVEVPDNYKNHENASQAFSKHGFIE